MTLDLTGGASTNPIIECHDETTAPSTVCALLASEVEVAITKSGGEASCITEEAESMMAMIVR